MQIEKALINDRWLVSKWSWKFCIPTSYNFAVIYPWNLQFSQKVTYFFTGTIIFLFINKTLRFNNLKNRAAMNAKTSMFVICVEAIMYLSLYNLHDNTLKILFRGHMLLLILMVKKCWNVLRKKLQKANQTEFRVEKVIKRKGDKLYVKWKDYDSSFKADNDKNNIVIDKTELVKKI